MDITERVSYLKGLAEGLEISDKSNEGKLLLAVIDVLQDIASELKDIDESLDNVFEDIEDIDTVIDMMAKDTLGIDDDDDGDDDFAYDLKCPSCGAELDIGLGQIEAGHMECPSCGQALEVTSGCGTCCGHDHAEE